MVCWGIFSVLVDLTWNDPVQNLLFPSIYQALITVCGLLSVSVVDAQAYDDDDDDDDDDVRSTAAAATADRPTQQLPSGLHTATLAAYH